MNAERLPDGQIRMSSGAWFDVFHADKLEAWISFYENMHTEYGQSKYKTWAETLRALAPKT